MPAPAQLYIAPDVVELAEIAPLDAPPQLNVIGAPAVTFGGVVLLVTATVEVVVHPFAGSVIVTVYVPGAFTVGEEVVPPAVTPAPDQLYVAPVVVELAEIVPLEVVQVNDNGEPAVTFGVVVLDVTATVVVEVQPFAGSVIVAVYVPVAFTVGEDVAPPAVIPAPDQLYVAPVVVELAEIVPLKVVHVKVNGVPAVAFGGVVLLVTATVC